jgi:hypothetical protein
MICVVQEQYWYCIWVEYDWETGWIVGFWSWYVTVRCDGILLNQNHQPWLTMVNGKNMVIIWLMMVNNNLVGGFSPPLWKKNFVKWDYDIPDWMGNHKIPWIQTTNQNQYIIGFNGMQRDITCQHISISVLHIKKVERCDILPNK